MQIGNVIKNKKLVIVGSGENALLAYEFFTYDSEYQVYAFAVNSMFRNVSEIYSLPVINLEDMTKIYPASEYFVFVAMGSGMLNHQRQFVYAQVKSMGYSCVNYISSKAVVWHNVKIGENCFILANCILQPFSEIGDNVTLWYNSNVGHRAVIRDHAFLASAAVASFSEIGEYSFLGAGVLVADHVKVSANNFVALGSVINKSTEENCVYRGNPASKLKISAKKFCRVEE